MELKDLIIRCSITVVVSELRALTVVIIALELFGNSTCIIFYICIVHTEVWLDLNTLDLPLLTGLCLVLGIELVSYNACVVTKTLEAYIECVGQDPGQCAYYLEVSICCEVLNIAV